MYPHDGLLDLDDAGEVYGRSHQDRIDAVANGRKDLFYLLHLGEPVSHRRHDVAQVLEVVEGPLEVADSVGPGVEDLLGPELLGRDITDSIGLFPVGHGGPVLENDDGLALDELGVVQRWRGLAVYDRRAPVDLADVLLDLLDIRGLCRIDLVDYYDICYPQIDAAGVVHKLLAGPEGLDDAEGEVWFVEGGVVVAAVPDYDVCFLFGPSKYGFESTPA
jgi:hypothetical protein